LVVRRARPTSQYCAPSIDLKGHAMGSAENKQRLQDVFAATANGDGRLFFESLADDAVYTVTGQYSWSRSFHGKQAMLRGLFGHLRTILVPPQKTIAQRFIAEGDHVVVEARGDNTTRAGQRYDNQYCMVFRFNERGLVAEVREYCDSILAESALGPYPSA
jgi:ketosteroid isomerase-like protein